MIVGTLLQLVQLYGSGTLKLLPLTDVLGMWLGIVGTLLVALGCRGDRGPGDPCALDRWSTPHDHVPAPAPEVVRSP